MPSLYSRSIVRSRANLFLKPTSSEQFDQLDIVLSTHLVNVLHTHTFMFTLH